MKKLAAFSLLVVFLFNSFGYYFVFHIARFQIREEVRSQIKRSLPEEELTVITFAKDAVSDIIWEEENKEFFYSGQLFDVVKKVETASSITYYCTTDKKESELYAFLEEHIDLMLKHDTDGNHSSKKLTDHLSKSYYAAAYRFDFYTASSSAAFYSPSDIYLSVFTEITSPPPDLV